MSGDPEQEYFADGMVEEIITALSRMRWLFVIARNSSFTYKGRAVDVKQVGRELGVRYVLEGSVRKAGNRVRITGQLIDAATGAHLWADRFDGALEDIFDLQDQVTASVVGAIAPKLEQAEIERAKRKPTESLDAYDYYLRGMAAFHQWTREANNEALPLFYRAIELDPNFASAYGMAARCYVQRKANGWVTDRAQEIAETATAGAAGGGVGQGRRGRALCGRALRSPMSSATSRRRCLHRSGSRAQSEPGGGVASQRLGEGLSRRAGGRDRAPRTRHAPEPARPAHVRDADGTTSSRIFAGRYDEASTWARKGDAGAHELPACITLAAASHACAGRLAEAQE